MNVDLEVIQFMLIINKTLFQHDQCKNVLIIAVC